MDHLGTTKRWLRTASLLTLGFTITGCDQIQGLELPAFLQGDGSGGTANNLAAAPAGAVETRDVEAPEVFQKTETGLWDGRPSLGGIWVAHPDVGDPERVIIRNEDNGRFINGALFRRERENPGPPFQVSSDAAEELGLLAGSPARLNVTALRREEIAPATPIIADDTGFSGADVPLAPPSAISETPLDAATDSAGAAASASVGAIAGAAAAAPLAAPSAPVATGASAAATSTIDAIAGAAAAVAAAEAEATLETGAPLDARGTAGDTIPLPEPIASGLEKPFVQVGIFSVEGNASDAADTLRGAGISASVVEQNNAGTAFWRVLVGPAPTAQDRTTVLAQVQTLGFNDAYFVSN